MTRILEQLEAEEGFVGHAYADSLGFVTAVSYTPLTLPTKRHM